jgi:hypothetical protein
MSTLINAKDGDVIQLPWGQVVFHNNEVHIVSTVDDPPAISFIAPGPGTGLGKVSFKDHAGREVVLLQGKVSANGGGEIYVGVLDGAKYAALTNMGDRNALDKAMTEVVNIQAGLIEFKVPTNLATGSAGRVTRFYSDDGRFCFNVQGPGSGQPDGAVIQYDTHHSVDESTWTPVAEFKATVRL